MSSNVTQQYDNVLDGIMERMKESSGERNAETTVWEQNFFCQKKCIIHSKKNITTFQSNIDEGGSEGGVPIDANLNETTVQSENIAMKERKVELKMKITYVTKELL